MAYAIVRAIGVIAAIGVAAESPAGAQTAAPSPAASSSSVVQAVYDCRAIADTAQRLACFDAAVAALAAAESARDIRIADRAQVREARRGLFGLSLRNLNIFGGGGNDEDSAAARADPDFVEQIEATLSNVERDGVGHLVLTLDNGQRWIQTDGGGGGRTPRAGTAVTIRRGALGSFIASMAGRQGLRVRRER